MRILKQLKAGGIARALRHGDYRRFAGGDLVSLIGNWVQRVAVGWLTWQLTESGTWLGIIAFAELAPAIVFSPLGGAYADRVDRLRMSIGTQAILMGQAASLAALTFAEIIDIWSLLVLTGARGCLNAWSHPARQALIPSLVPHEDLPAAIALNSVLFNTARFIGPAIAGIIIVKGGIGHAFAFNTATFVVFLFVLIRLRLPYREAISRSRASLTAQVMEGYRYVVAHPGIGPILLLLLVTALFARPVGDLLPGFAGAVFGTGASGLAWMTSGMGLGAMVGGFVIAQRGHVTGLTGVAIANTLLMGIALLAFAFAPAFWLAVLALAVASFAMSTAGIACQSLVQHAVEGALRGRVISIYGLIFRAGPATGALVMGALSEHLGWHWPIAVGAVVCLAAWLWGQGKRRRLASFLEG
ncbi:MAG TPA: MFS transporter [Alphaproteobacteria bacterium]|jgi:MFS family permease